MWLGIFLKIIISFGQIQIYKSAHWNQNLTSLFHCFENCLHLFVYRYCKFTRTFSILRPVLVLLKIFCSEGQSVGHFAYFTNWADNVWVLWYLCWPIQHIANTFLDAIAGGWGSKVLNFLLKIHMMFIWHIWPF